MNRVVVTLMIGAEANNMGSISLPFMREYANKCSADFVVLKQSKLSEKTSPFYEKMQIGSLLQSYHMVLYIDIDVLVTPWAENLFIRVPSGKFGVVSVTDVFKQFTMQQNYLDIILGKIEWKLPYFNSGVMLASKNHASLFNTDDSMIERWITGKQRENIMALNDQNILNYRVNLQKVDLYLLENRFNFTRAWGCFSERFSKDFIHYAGFRGMRTNRMKRDAKILKSRLIGLYQSYPRMVKLIDRVWERIDG